MRHTHTWWHLVTITSGFVYKCDCGVFLEPPLTLPQRLMRAFSQLRHRKNATPHQPQRGGK